MLSFTEIFIDFYKDVQKIQAVLLATLSEKYPVYLFSANYISFALFKIRFICYLLFTI